MAMTDERPFDADNHYYEALDAFTRHLDPALGPRVIQWATIDGRQYHVLGGRVSRAVRNATFDPVSKPGVLADYFRGNPNAANPLERLRDHEPCAPSTATATPGSRSSTAHGLSAAWMFPTLGMIYEDLLKHDPEAVTLLFTAFNRWLDEDWGFAYQDRIYAAPYLTLADLDWACRELEWALDRGARLVVMRPAAPTTALGPRSPADPRVRPVLGARRGGRHHRRRARRRQRLHVARLRPRRLLHRLLRHPAADPHAAARASHRGLPVVAGCDRLFLRFPGLRVASVENGSKYLRGLFEKLHITAKKMGGWFGEDPVDTFRRHIWINPFWEDDAKEVVELMGADRVIFGSDWPHIEGLPEPLDYLSELAPFDDDAKRRIIRDNTVELTGPPA